MKTFLRASTLCLLILLPIGTAAAAPQRPAGAAEARDAVTLDGTWRGDLEVPGATLRLALEISGGSSDSPNATVISLDQGNARLPVNTFERSGKRVEFTVQMVGGSFIGTLDEAGDTLAGTWTQSGQTFPLSFARRATDPPATAAAATPDGKTVDIARRLASSPWSGTIEIPGQPLRMVAYFTPDGDGGLQGRLVSPDQGNAEIPIEELAINGANVKLTAPAAGVTFEGTLSDDGERITGTFRQGPGSFPLELTRGEAEGPKRPQHPRPPFPYRVSEVKIPNAEAGIELAGTLTRPQGDGPFPAVVLVTGSGPQNRDEEILGHKPFLVLADHLTRRGFAVLRYDDRGIGKSGGTFRGATSEDFATDTWAAVEFLTAQEGIAPDRVGILGHSEGGIVAPMVAVEHPASVAFLVLLAAPGLPGAQVISQQVGDIALASGLPENVARAQQTMQEKIEGAVAASSGLEDLKERLNAILDEAGAPPAAKQQILAQAETLNDPWRRYFTAYDPRPALTRIKVPVLALTGDKDRQVAPEGNLAAIEKALKEGGNTAYTARALPGLNHLFQTAETGGPGEYGQLEETFAPAALEAIGEWLVERFGTGGGAED
ncbi:MAG: alpha/beta fold hydrolase [Acidobacteriota bacterium]